MKLIKEQSPRMIQVMYEWHVPDENQAAFLAAWERTTVAIRETTAGARGSLCVVSANAPTRIYTIAKWDHLEQWQRFVKNAKSDSMREMHALGTQLSHEAFEQKGDHTI